MSEPAQEQFVSRNGDQLLYRFHVPAAPNVWTIQFNNKTAAAGEIGTFSAGTQDRLLRRVTLDALDISPDIGLRSLHLDVAYEPAEVSGKKVLLPATADVVAFESNRTIDRSHMQFSACRAFVAESNLSF